MEQAARFVLAHRRLIAAALVGLSVWAALTALDRSPTTRAVLVAAHDLPSGTQVRSADLASVRLPGTVVPDGTIDEADITGRSLSGGMRAGEVFTDRRVVDPRDLGGGDVLAVVEVAAATGEMLRAGDAVDVVAVDDDGAATTVLRAAEVVTVRTDETRDAAVLGLAATPEGATELARVSVTSRLSAVVTTRQ